MVLKLPPEKTERVYLTAPPPSHESVDCAVVCVGGHATKDTARRFADTGVAVCTLVDWPLGIGKPTVRQIEAVSACKDDTDAIEIPATPRLLVSGEVDALRDELLGVVIAAREVNPRVMIQVALDAQWIGLGSKPLRCVCDAIREAGVDGIVTSTGRPSDTETVAAYRAAISGLRIKAYATAGDESHALALMAAGADAVGVMPSSMDHC